MFCALSQISTPFWKKKIMHASYSKLYIRNSKKKKKKKAAKFKLTSSSWVINHNNILTVLIHGGALTEKWGIFGPEVSLFSHPPGHSQDPHLSIFQFSWPYFTPKSQISKNFKPQSLKIRKEFHSKASNWAEIQFTWLYFIKKFSSQGSKIWQWPIHKLCCSQ